MPALVVAADPQFANPKIFQHAIEAIEMVVVGVSERHDVEALQAPRP